MNTINILMLGGKRCGKTTVIASMLEDIPKALAGTDVSFSFSNTQSVSELLAARRAIESKMKEFQGKALTRVSVDENPTSALHTYQAELKIGTDSVAVNFTDVPGEWLTDKHQQTIKELVQSSQVIVIAIDTPYLFAKMGDTGYGIFHEEYNKPGDIANFFKKSLSVDDLRERMILFVPLKCERYYHLTHTPQLNINGRDYMQEIDNAIAVGYSELLLYLKSTKEIAQSTTIAITPILSAGGIDFVRFEKDPDTDRIISLYQEPEFLSDSEYGFCPKYCEQPLIYTLVYIMMQHQMKKVKKDNLLFDFSNNLFRHASEEKIESALKTLKKKMKRNTGVFSEDGFYIIQNPIGL